MTKCLPAKELLQRLVDAGHAVRSSREVAGTAAADAKVLNVAKFDRRAVLTSDCADRVALHGRDPEQSGLLLACEDNDQRDMSWAQIVDALSAVERAHFDGINSLLLTLDICR